MCTGVRMDRFLKQDGDRDREFLTLTLGAEEYGIDILKVQEIRDYILALSAAVEQGRGFAVVAGEVRNLAQRSASAAKEIKTLISESVAKVSNGYKLVESAGQTMGEIVASTQDVAHIMSEISSASEEQRNGIMQLNAAMTSLDETTQQNAALVEEAAAAAQSLEDQVISLSKAVSVFRVDGRVRDSEESSGSRMRIERRPFNVSSSQRSRSASLSNADGEWEAF